MPTKPDFRPSISVCAQGRHVFGCIVDNKIRNCEECGMGGKRECTINQRLNFLDRLSLGEAIPFKEVIKQERIMACPACQKLNQEIQAALVPESITTC